MLNGQTLASLGAPPGQNLAAGGLFHPNTEAVALGALALFGFVSK